MKVKVDGLVREGGKLITEAKLINSLDLSLVCEAVILLLGFPVDGVPQGVLHIAVNVVVASSDDLTTTKDTHSLLLPERQTPLTKGRPGSDYMSQTFFSFNLHSLLKADTPRFTEDDTEAERAEVNWPWSCRLKVTELRLESMSA